MTHLRSGSAYSMDAYDGTSTLPSSSSLPLPDSTILPLEDDAPRPPSKTSRCDSWFPYPASVNLILFNELCERFSYYGNRAILSLFLKSIDFSDRETVLTFSLFSALAYTMPLIGGHIADSFLGRYRTIVIFSFIYFLGALLMAFAASTLIDSSKDPIAVFISLTLTSIGTGGIKPCVSTFGADQVNMTSKRKAKRLLKDTSSGRPSPARSRSSSTDRLLEHGDGDRHMATTTTDIHDISRITSHLPPDGTESLIPSDDHHQQQQPQEHEHEESKKPIITSESFFIVFYFTMNVGSTLATIFIPIIRTRVSYFWAFLVPSIFMLLSIVILVIGNFFKQFHHVKPEGGILSVIFLTCYRGCRRRKWLKYTYTIPIQHTPFHTTHNDPAQGDHNDDVDTNNAVNVNAHSFVRYVHQYYDYIITHNHGLHHDKSNQPSSSHEEKKEAGDYGYEYPSWLVSNYTCPFDTKYHGKSTSDYTKLLTFACSCPAGCNCACQQQQRRYLQQQEDASESYMTSSYYDSSIPVLVSRLYPGFQPSFPSPLQQPSFGTGSSSDGDDSHQQQSYQQAGGHSHQLQQISCSCCTGASSLYHPNPPSSTSGQHSCCEVHPTPLEVPTSSSASSSLVSVNQLDPMHVSDIVEAVSSLPLEDDDDSTDGDANSQGDQDQSLITTSHHSKRAVQKQSELPLMSVQDQRTFYSRLPDAQSCWSPYRIVHQICPWLDLAADEYTVLDYIRPDIQSPHHFTISSEDIVLPLQYPPTTSKKYKIDGYSVESLRYVLITLPVLATLPIFWSLMNQQGSTWMVQAEEMRLNFYGWHIEPEQMSVLNPIFLFILLPLLEWFVRRLRRKAVSQEEANQDDVQQHSSVEHSIDNSVNTHAYENISATPSDIPGTGVDPQIYQNDIAVTSSQNTLQPSEHQHQKTSGSKKTNQHKSWFTSPLNKMALGMASACIAYVCAALVDIHIRNNEPNSVTILWQIPQYLMVTIAEVLISVTGLYFVFDMAPPHLKSFVTGLLMLSSAIGDVFTGLFYQLFEWMGLSRPGMFIAFSISIVINSIGIFIIKRLYGKLYRF